MKTNMASWWKLPSTARFGALLSIALVCCALTPGAVAQSPRGTASIDDTDIIQAKKEALRWLDLYLTNTVLIDQKAVEKIHDTVARMTPEELRQWLKQTDQLRAFVESDSWQSTRQWLRQFLQVQAIYSDAELAEFRKKIESADAAELVKIMEQIQAKQATMNWMHQASAVTKQAQLSARKATLSANSKAAAAARRPAASSSSRPLVGSSPATKKKSSSYKGYRVPGPLINSREVANESVRRSLFPRGGWYGW